AVAVDEAFGALGSDTGGSVWEPAALCGVGGLKTTYRRGCRFRLVARSLVPAQSCPGSKNVPAASLTSDPMRRAYPHHSASLHDTVPDYLAELGNDLRGVRLGVPKEYMIEGIDPQVRAAIDAAVKQLNSLGAEIVEVSLPSTEYAITVYYIIATAEASAN